MKHVSLLAVVLLLGSGCGEVDTSELAPMDDYQSWVQVETSGKVGGHGDGFRLIYANELATQYTGAGSYDLGSVIVKEIYGTRDGARGDLRYVSIMRRLEEAPPGGELQGGWLFTRAAEVGDAEVPGFTCWDGCHVQAPYAGAWLDYGVVAAAAAGEN